MPSEEKPKKGTKEKRGSEKTKAAEIPVRTPGETEPVGSVKSADPLKTPPPVIVTTPESKPKKAAAPKSTSVKAPAVKSQSAAGKRAGKVTLEQIQLRAYFIAERRKNQGIAGDEASDWIQAERELKIELDQ
jgi:DUF2934 family protein